MKLKEFGLILLCLLCGNTVVFAQTATQSVIAKEKISSLEIRQAAFDKVWNTINERHFDETFGGVDWKKMREIYEPQAKSAKSDADFHAVLQKMLGELKVSHLNVITSESGIGTGQPPEGEIGIELQIIDGKPVISRLRANSNAAQSGLKTGFIIEKINDKTVTEVLAKVEEKIAKRPEGETAKNGMRSQVLLYNINGVSGTKVKLDVLNEKNQPQIFEIERKKFEGESSPAFGNFPPQLIEFEARKLDGNIGYIRFNIWVMAQMPKIRQAVKSFADTKGIIFDVRGNPGGLGVMASGIAGMMAKEQTSLGSMKSRGSNQQLIVYPQPNPFTGKIMILTDSGSGSTSEIFAAGMQDLGRAKIIGEKSAGAILASIIDTIPTGALFQYVVSDYKSPRNILIEGKGVTPDIEVKPTRESLLAGSDAQIDAAIREISRQ